MITLLESVREFGAAVVIGSAALAILRLRALIKR